MTTSCDNTKKRIEQLRNDLSAVVRHEYVPPPKYPSDGCTALEVEESPDTTTRLRAEEELKARLEIAIDTWAG